MNTIIISKMACNDSMLKSSSKFGEEEVKDVLDVAFAFTPFSVIQTELVLARISEKYYLACKKLGYTDSFFGNHTILALSRLNLHSTYDFEAVYIPFSGEVFLVPSNSFELMTITEKSIDITLHKQADEKCELEFKRRFDICMDKKEKEPSFWNKCRAKAIGERLHDPENKRIFSLTAREDLCIITEKGKNPKEETQHAMHYLYNEFAL